MRIVSLPSRWKLCNIRITAPTTVRVCVCVLCCRNQLQVAHIWHFNHSYKQCMTYQLQCAPWNLYTLLLADCSTFATHCVRFFAKRQSFPHCHAKAPHITLAVKLEVIHALRRIPLQRPLAGNLRLHRQTKNNGRQLKPSSVPPKREWMQTHTNSSHLVVLTAKTKCTGHAKVADLAELLGDNKHITSRQISMNEPLGLQVSHALHTVWMNCLEHFTKWQSHCTYTSIH